MQLPAGQTWFFLALGLWLCTAYLRRRLAQRRPSFATRTFFDELSAPLRLLFFYLAARLVRTYAGDAVHMSVAHALDAGATFALATGVLRLADSLIAALFRFRGRPGAPRIVRSLGVWLLTFGIAAFVLRVEYRFDLSSLFATSALLSVVFGFALQETLGNLFAGLTLHAEEPFEQGEWVSFGKYSGRILDVGWRSTRLLTADEDELLVPNSMIAREVVINHMRPHASDVVDFPLELDVDVSPVRAKAVLLDAVQSCPLVLREPAPRVQIAGFTQHGVQYRVRFMTEGVHMDRLAVDQVHEAIWYALRRAAIDVPFPQQTVSFRERALEADERRRREHAAEATELLGRVDFVRVLGDEARRTLAERARFLEYGPGQAVVRQGEPGDTLYLIARGELAVRVRAEGAEEKELARLGRGAFFGEMSVLTGEPRTATVVALTDAALLMLDRAAFERVLTAEPELLDRLAATLASRRVALDAAHAEGPAPASAETSTLLSRLTAIFGFQRRAS